MFTTVTTRQENFTCGENAAASNAENSARADVLQHKVSGFSLIAAPLLLMLSTLFWSDGRTSGGIQLYAFALMIPALLAVQNLLRAKMPRYVVWAGLAAVLLCIFGAAYGVDRLFASAYNIAGTSTLGSEAFYQAAGTAGLMVFLPGVLFPVHLIVLGIVLLRSRTASTWMAVCIALSGILFPIGRISRTEAVAFASDALLLIPLARIGWQYLKHVNA